jgi:16S rRNA (uracil1498-N3)-methyltransferase
MVERFFLEETFSKGDSLSLEGKEFHHLYVMRARLGSTIEIINGKGCIAIATLTNMASKLATLSIQEVLLHPPLEPPIIIAQGIPRQNHLEYLIEKGTELGATSFWLFPAERSEKKSLSLQQLLRLRTIAISAIKQCGALHLPEIILKPSLAEFSGQGQEFFGDLRPSAPWFSPPKSKEAITFFVGPEKGFSKEEISILETRGAKGVKLHSYILRTETAPLAALAILRGGFNHTC